MFYSKLLKLLPNFHLIYFLLFCISLHLKPGPLENICRKSLAYEKKKYGEKPAEKWYQSITETALREMQCNKKIPILQLNTRDQNLGLATANGIWLRHWTDSPNIKKFVAYHEAAHIALKHPESGRVFSILNPVFCSVVACYLVLFIDADDDLLRVILRYIASVGISLLLYKLTVCKYLRNKEQQANSFAAQVLCQTNNEKAITSRLKNSFYTETCSIFNIFNTHPTEYETQCNLKRILLKAKK